MATLAGDERDGGRLLAAEASQHRVPGGLNKRRGARPVASCLLGKRAREGVVDLDRDLVAHARRRRRPRVNGSTGERMSPSSSQKARAARASSSPESLSSCCHAEKSAYWSGSSTSSRRASGCDTSPSSSAARRRIGAQRGDVSRSARCGLAEVRRASLARAVPARGRTAPASSAWRVRSSCSDAHSGRRCERSSISKRGASERVDHLQRERQARLARERRAQDLVPARDRVSQGVRDRGRLDGAVDREDGLRAGRRTVWLGGPEVLLLRRDLKAVVGAI